MARSNKRSAERRARRQPTERRKRRKPKDSEAGPAKASASTRRGALRKLVGRFSESRYEPQATLGGVIAVVMMSLGGVALGAGLWAMLLLEPGRPAATYGPYGAALGALLLVGFLLARRDGKVLRVGELGVAVEADGKLARTAWFEVHRLSMSNAALRLTTDRQPLQIPLRTQRAAAARIVAEALKRIPKRVELEDDDLARIGEPGEEGEQLSVDPPQVAGRRCRSSDQTLTFEKDVRMCGRCGALYHCDSVPRRCSECASKLGKSSRSR